MNAKVIFQNSNILFKHFSRLNSYEQTFTYEQFTLLNWFCNCDLKFRSIKIFSDGTVSGYDSNLHEHHITDGFFKIFSDDIKNNRKFSSRLDIDRESGKVKFSEISIKPLK